MLYECSIRYDKMQENGAVKRVTESYLVDAVSFTEAEARIIAEQTPYISGQFDVVAIKRTNYSEVVNADADADHWFKAKLVYITIDERTAREKRTPVSYIVNADTIDHARRAVDDFMHGSMADYVIVTLDETKILDVYRYQPADDE